MTSLDEPIDAKDVLPSSCYLRNAQINPHMHAGARMANLKIGSGDGSDVYNSQSM